MKAPLILFFNKFDKAVIKRFENHPGDYRLSCDRSKIAQANAVLVNIGKLFTRMQKLDTLFQLLRRHPSHQKWVAWSRESSENYPLLKKSWFMALFDVTMTYRQDSTLWDPYFDHQIVQKIMETSPLPKTETAPVVSFISSPTNKSGRQQIATDLMKKIQIDSYGQWQRNRTLTNDVGRESKLATIARYKFTLAFENSITEDYVTEKFFQPLMVGSVPVYLGAPNVHKFAPSPKSYINVTDFRSTDELADYLDYLANNEAAYNQYLSWKTEGITNPILKKTAQEKKDVYEHFCQKVITQSL